jgi:hypothetical protein
MIPSLPGIRLFVKRGRNCRKAAVLYASGGLSVPGILRLYSASTQKISIQNLRKSAAHVPIMGIIFTPWGADGSCARDWRGAEQTRCMATTGVHASGPVRESAEPRKARFFAGQKMRPKKVLKKTPISVSSFQVEVLYRRRQG